jgi:type III pantothenate kinase
MIFSVDIGNTFIKIGGFEDNVLVFFAERLALDQLIFLCLKHKPTKIVVCDVAQKATNFIEALANASPALSKNILQLTWQTPLPIKNLYETPQTLGMDRLAAVLGAWRLYPNQPCLVIDAGSCVTYDLLTQDSQYAGGSISLGIRMRFRALHEFTAKLPLLEPTPVEVDLVGKNTNSALQSGVIRGFCFEMQGIIAEYQRRFEDLQIILCGGDANFLHFHLNLPEIEVRQTLLLEGLAVVAVES